MTFGKKAVKSGGNGGGNFDSGAWNDWNRYINEEVLEGEWSELPNGKLRKEITAVGVLNFIMDIGTQEQGDASMKSPLPAPEGDEEFSPEEMEEMEKNPSNYFKWVDEWDNGKKKSVRKKFWPKQPESELIFAIDFPDQRADYSKHPMAAEDAVEEFKPYRIDYNGKDFKEKTELGRHITNEVHWKTGKFGDKDIKYKIASACGFLNEYVEDEHDLSHLVQATCNWTIVVTKTITEKDGKEVVYYNQSIKDPEPVVDIKLRGKVVASKEEQLECAQDIPPFCGILMNDGEYPKENLAQVRDMWWNIAKRASTFDRNEVLGRDTEDEWIVGEGWEGSDLEKAYKKVGLAKEADKKAQKKASQPKQQSQKQEPPKQQQAPAEKEKEQEPQQQYNEPPMDFDDD